MMGMYESRKKIKKITTFAIIVNQECEDFKLFELSTDNLKCLNFAQGLTSAKDAEIRRRIMNKLDYEPSITLQ